MLNIAARSGTLHWLQDLLEGKLSHTIPGRGDPSRLEEGRVIQNFERKFQSEQAAGSVSKSTQFEYAWCLVRSKYNDDIRKGILLLEELLPKGSKEEQRDYVFYLAVGNYRLKEYEKALKYVRGLLQTEPQNNQAKELERLIDKAMKKDGLVGMAIVGGMALGVAGLAGLIGLAVSKSKS
ncbi:mitochondrial fission 1 protein isoform X1 [Peromyscus eremicus]|uniref:mitochondrial fission 1 protein isoform X1 n=1 Tax=Peromyscus eremicus TaxID=42410 RepID=UPI0027DDECD9|nr:mitochondrial fission 1 protein isoform X1 [Peromyscus eremicus]XP_059105675.1 mitochondrial fission 1 protein isoform X1 [Peromyscus eremicus]